MNLFGLEITLKKRAYPQGLNSVGYYNAYGPYYGPILESFTGAWQTNTVVAPTTTLLSFSAVYACITGISADIAKMPIKLSRNEGGIWEEVTSNSPWLPLLRMPNSYQDRIKFFECWMLSKLMYGNAYILKHRQDRRGLVTSMHVLHPNCIRPLVAENGDVYYEIDRDDLSRTEELENVNPDRFTVPASEIIHDRMAPLWHPLVGVSPLYACGASASLGTAIQANATKFFANASRPGGMLSAPGAISDGTAARLKAAFESNFSGDNVGKLFVAGDGLDFKQFGLDAQKSQQVEQSKEAVENVARAFRYPLWKLGGPTPPYTKPDQAQTSYYTDCLQQHVESIELCLDHGLELPAGLGTEFDLEVLMRMDTEALFESNNKASSWMKLDEQRFRANYKPLNVGGDTVWKQEQDHSIESLAKRDAAADPFGTAAPTPAPTPLPAEPAPTRQLETHLTAEELMLLEDEYREELLTHG